MSCDLLPHEPGEAKGGSGARAAWRALQCASSAERRGAVCSCGPCACARLFWLLGDEAELVGHVQGYPIQREPDRAG
jgi:hypothetical protein